MYIVNYILYFVLYFIETTLSFRFLLKFLGANESNFFINWLYEFTSVLTEPFLNIFNDIVFGRFTVEISTIIAMVIYAFFGIFILEFLEVIVKRREK